jgi:signal transduction histidine kinase
MFNSIFRRIIIPNLILTLILVISLTVAVSNLYRNALVDEKHRSLEAGAKELSLEAASYLGGGTTLDELNAAVNAVSSSSEAMVYIIQIDPAKLQENTLLQNTGLQDDFVDENLTHILEGKSVFSTAPYSDTFAAYVLFQGYPIYLDGEVHGAVLLLSPVDSLRALFYDINLTAAGIAASVLLISFPLIWWFSRRISEPIRKMEAATRRIAAGEPAALDPIKTKDEVGRLSDSFLQMKAALEKTEALRKELIANVSHELRTPLTSIRGFVQALRDGVVPLEEQSEILGLIQEEALRLTNLTDDLLELAKLQAAAKPLQLEQAELEPLIQQVLNSFSQTASERNLDLTAEIEAGLSLMIDPNAFKQILCNLLDNAIKYSPPGGKVAIRGVTASEATVKLEVEDQGIGIPEEALAMVFDKFYRAESGSQVGTGLGLSIVKQLVLLHGGSIRAEKNVPEGTRIVIIFPRNISPQIQQSLNQKP